MTLSKNCWLVLFILLFSTHSCWSCLVLKGNYDLSILKGIWPVIAPERPGYRYEINLCDPLNYESSPQKEACEGSSVCTFSGADALSLGKFISNSSDYVVIENPADSGFSLFLTSFSDCKKNDSGQARSVISFSCGSNLGSPELISFSECQAYFFWRTSAACKTIPKHHEVPCYTFDAGDNKIDLSPLIKQRGAYNIETSDSSTQFMINVCSDIVSGDEIKHCPENNSACRIKGNEIASIGELTDGLQYAENGTFLTYKTASASCAEVTTTILFKCMGRLKSHPPRLVSQSSCSYDIEWETEYACPEKLLNGKECRFVKEDHEVDIDLSPLRLEKGQYEVDGNKSKGPVKFFLNVCAGLGNMTCNGANWKFVSACEVDLGTNTNTSFVIGTTAYSQLKFADGEIFLTYTGKKECATGQQERTIINFVCSSDGVESKPKHVSSDDCINLFEWKTAHACLKTVPAISCLVKEEGKTILLNRLQKTKGDAWEIVDGRVKKGDAGEQFFMNVCGDVSLLGNLSGCGSGAALCMIDNTGKFNNLGRFESPPVYDSISDTVSLNYTNGSKCNDKQNWTSYIRLKCRPGHLKATPVLLQSDSERCLYEFEWHTAEVCPMGYLSGSNCKISNPDLGLDFDLSPLMPAVYEIETETHKLYLSVCQELSHSLCSTGSEATETSLCQVDKRVNKSVAVTVPSNRMTYIDGYVYLNYSFSDAFKKSYGIPALRNASIVFICDNSAGNGKPQLADKLNLTYVFYWYTNLVCLHSASTECIVHDPSSHQVYDLSSLSREDRNWITTYTGDTNAKKVYINICRPLVANPLCDNNAAVCLVDTKDGKEVPFISNAGQANHKPEFTSDGHLQLSYSHGKSCIAFGQKTTYTTIIHFLCSKNIGLEQGLRSLGKVGACQYSFLWTTSAACPTGETIVTDECKLTDPDTGFVYDLATLKSGNAPYTVSSGSKFYQLAICGAVKGGCFDENDKVSTPNISVCEANKDGKLLHTLANTQSYTLSYSKESDLRLTYKSQSSESSEVVIKFPCDNSTAGSISTLRFLRQENERYIFEMKTSITCQFENFDCNFIDEKGNEYDLTPLSKTTGLNWIVNDGRHEHSDLRYYINFCKSLNTVQGYKCPGGATAACQVSVHDPLTEGVSLGSQFDYPTVSADGTVTLHYRDGSFCHNGQFRRSVSITLFCSEKQSDLVFMGETPECEYMFSLSSPAACPLQDSHGSDCTVTDSTFGYTFDLSPLKKITASTVSGEYQYFVKVCDHLDQVAKTCDNAAACQIKRSDPSFSKNLGLPNSNLAYRKGVIAVKYEEGTSKCHGEYNRSTTITFTCDHDADDSAGLSFVSEAEDCTYSFEWPTKYACPPFETVECSARDDEGYLYDLTALSLTSSNYYVKNPISLSQTFIINICRSVVHTPDSLCPYSAAACLVTPSEVDPLKRRMSIGRAEHSPYFENNKLRIKYTSGEPCPSADSSAAHFMETVIEFTCDEHSVQSEPEFIGVDGCTYHFDWSTAFACRADEPLSSADCSVKDPYTGYLFNLSSLRIDPPHMVQTNNHQYYINICGNVKSSPCGAQSGACQEELRHDHSNRTSRHWNTGKPNSNLKWKERVLFLNYSGGDSCHQDRFERNTIIQFHCGVGIGKPEFLYETADCTYYFTWITELACQNLVHCAIKNGTNHYSLTPLSNSGPIAVRSTLKDDDAVYHINVCGPLGNIPGLPCPPTSSVCRVQTNGTHAVSLGNVEFPPFMDFSGHPTAIYTNGSPCARYPSETNRARIIFLCDPKEPLGEPVLVSITEDCFYLFEWKTSIVCHSTPEQKSCLFKDVGRGIYFDLSSISNVHSYYEVNDIGTNGTFLINVCDTVNSSMLQKCTGASVCFQDGDIVENYGLASTQTFSYDEVRLHMSLSNGNDCTNYGRNEKRSTKIFFLCDPHAGIGRPTFYSRYPCSVMFMWRTNLVCRNLQHQCFFEFGNQIYDLHMLSSISHNWDFTDGKGNMYWLNLCRGIVQNDQTSGCPPSAAVCMRDSTGSHMPLGMVYSVKSKQPNSSALLLTYNSENSQPCSLLKTATPVNATTRISLICGSFLGSPRFLSGPDDKCYYDFVWETNIVCPDNGGEYLVEENGLLRDKFHEMDIKPILNRTFVVEGTSATDKYVYLINLSGVYQSGTDSMDPCAGAVVCQTKPSTGFKRDIGSINTRAFFTRGGELSLTLTSTNGSCGKRHGRNVTTIFQMQCSGAAGVAHIEFLHESDGCEYIFSWDTYAVCPDFYRPDGKKKNDDNSVDAYSQKSSESSHRTATVIGFVFLAIIVCYAVFVLSKAERRSAMASKFRICFNRVALPRFRYRRGDALTELQSDF